MKEFEKTDVNRVKRHPERGAYEKEVIYQIVDEAIICHVGFVHDNQPYVIPTLHARKDDDILIHGASSSRLMKHAQAGHPLCLTMTLIDGLVLARAAFSHSINYRSAVLFGKGAIIDDDQEKMSALAYFTDVLMPGRWDDVRQPTENEMKATSIISIPIDLASAKIRQGPPADDESDLDLDVWAGVLPIQRQVGTPIADPLLKDGLELPENVRRYVKNQGR